LFKGKGGATGDPQYSRAFDNIVQDEDDVVGLLAYALYKRAIREDAQEGRRSSGDGRNPSRTVVETYRRAAEMTLSEVIQNSLEQARPELQVSAALDAVDGARSDIIEHVTRRTNWLPALVTNVVAWAFTLLIATLLLSSLGRPSPEEAVSSAAQRAIGTVTDEPASPATPEKSENLPPQVGS